MGMTFSIGSTEFVDNSISNGRQAIDISFQAAGYDTRRFHVPGTNGNIILRAGRVGQIITCAMRYIGASLVATRAMYRNDIGDFVNVAIVITDDQGNTHSNCNLTSMVVVSPPRATGRATGQSFMDAVATFTRDD